MPRPSIRFEDLDIELMTVDTAQPLTPTDILDLYDAALKRKTDAEEDLNTLRQMLTELRTKGILEDELKSDTLAIKWQSRSTWSYSSAIKQAQQLEQADGTATKKTTEGWAIRRITPQF